MKRKMRLIMCSLLVCWSISSVAGKAMCVDNYVLVSTLPHGASNVGFAACYDSDHDGLNEFYLTDGATVRVYEYRGNHEYQQVDTLEDATLWAVRDVDKDGLADVVVQNSTHVMVYESRRGDSL
ncbi:MAG: FG-GAP repeat domain-containing protein, partial [bacterium]